VAVVGHGARRRFAKRRKALGFTQESLATLLNVERSTVVRWEAGKSEPLAWLWPKLTAALKVTPEQLTDLLAEGSNHVQLTRIVDKDGQIEDDMKRRDMLKALGIGAVSMTVPTSSHADTLAAISSRGGKVGQFEVASLFAHTARLRRLDNFLGGADTYNLYASELIKTTNFVRKASCTNDTRQALTCIVAEQAQLAGWAAFDAGMQQEAKRHYLASLTAAREAQNSALAGNSLAFLAYQQIFTDKPSVDMATESYAMAKDDATPRVRALLLERMAWTHAVVGQAKETEKALEKAAEVITVKDGRPEPDWVFWVDGDEIEIMAGRCWTVLKRPLRAVPTLESVLERFDNTYARDKSMYLTWLAHAYIDADEIERGATVVARAIQLAMGVSSIRPMYYINSLIDRLKPHRNLTMVGDVMEQVGQ